MKDTPIVEDIQVQDTPIVEEIPKSVYENGPDAIWVLHQITLGDLLISTLLLVLIIFIVISRVVRR